MSTGSPLYVEERARDAPPPGKPPFDDMVWIPGGPFLMGSNAHYPEDEPAHPLAVSGFWMDGFAVTNAAFHRFVEATGSVTIAESLPMRHGPRKRWILRSATSDSGVSCECRRSRRRRVADVRTAR